MRLTGQSFKQALNQALRKGLADLADDHSEPAFDIDARPMHLRAGVDAARLNGLADDLEADAHADLTRSLLRRSGIHDRP